MLLLAIIAPTLAATFEVPDGVDTLAAAVRAAAGGDTIKIAAGWDGTEEGVIKITTGLIIAGDSDDPPLMPPLLVQGVSVDISDVSFTVLYEYVALSVVDAELSLTNVTFSDLDGYALVARNSSATLYDTDFTDVVRAAVDFEVDDDAPASCDLSIFGGVFTNVHGALDGSDGSDGSTVQLYGTTMSNAGQEVNAAILTSGLDLDIRDATFSGGGASDHGAIEFSGGTMSLSNTVFQNLRGGEKGYVVDGSNAEVSLSDLAFSWSDVPDSLSGVLSLTDLSKLSISGVTIDGASTTKVPMWISSSGPSTIDKLLVVNSSGPTGALWVENRGAVTITRSRFCANTATDGAIVHSAGPDIAVSGSIFASNKSDNAILYGATTTTTTTTTITNVDFIANTAPDGVLTGEATVLVQNTLFSQNERVFGFDALDGLDESYNLYFENGDDGIADFNEHDVWADPRFVSTFIADDCDTYPILGAGSPALDAGTGGNDPDDTLYDIGALSGSDPIIGALSRSDPIVPPSDPTDADGDGHNSSDDCDDEDPMAFPGGWDDPGTSADEDCDGNNATIRLAGGGCGCSAPPAAPGFAAFGIPAAIAMLRRRRWGW